MKSPRIFADFHNADKEGRLRLNCTGTIDDLARQGIQLADGLRVTIYSEDLEVAGDVEFSDGESVWVARIDWDAIKEVDSKSSETETIGVPSITMEGAATDLSPHPT